MPARVSALNHASFALFRDLDLTIPFLEKASAYEDMHVFESPDQPTLHFCAHELGEPHLGWIVANDDLCEMLWQACEPYHRTGQLITRWNSAFDDTEPLWQEDHWIQSWGQRAAYVIGADGTHSQVRLAHGISTSLIKPL
jgi:2-polyprenyl-6-methoxyphenol hydroxylase-like FAD-dependent oxidoreductase